MLLAKLGQIVIFFTLISSLAQPMGVAMDMALTSLLAGFMVLSTYLSMQPYLPKGCTLTGADAAKDASTREPTDMSVAQTPPTDGV